MVFKCAVIGCGRIGCSFDDNSKLTRTHAGAYSKCKKTELISLCDIDKNKLQKYGKKYKVSRLYSDYKLMFKENKFDIISICTHASNHHEIVGQAVKNGVSGIFIEKPFSNNLENALKIAKLCKKHKIKLVIDYQREYIPIYHKLKDYLESKKIGIIQKVIVHYGGGIANTGSHIFDNLLLLFGPAKNITSKLSPNKSNNKLDPNIDLVIEFKNKVTCIFNALDVSKYGILEMDVFGTKGRLRINMVKHMAQHFQVSRKGLVYNELKKAEKISARKENEPILRALEDLVKSIEKNLEPISSIKQGIESLELIIGAVISKNQNKMSTLPIKNTKFKISSK